MKRHGIELSVSQMSAADEIQSLAPRQNPGPMQVAGSRVFAIGARIGVGILYLACFTAAIAQSPEQSRLRSRSVVTRLAPRPHTPIAQASHDFQGKSQASKSPRP